MRTGRGCVRAVIIGASVFICLAWTLGNAAVSRAAISILHSFNGVSDGYSVVSGAPSFGGGCLALSGTTLYGMNNSGGTYKEVPGAGTIFRISTDGTGFQVLHTFHGGGSDGAYPQGSLTLSGTTLYGMTEGGGTSGDGIIFSINTDGTGFQILHSFGGTGDGSGAWGSLTLSGTTLYGMTEGGGTSGDGIIFRINTDGSGYEVMHSFSETTTDGGSPLGSLTTSGSVLYGMTQWGGLYDDGTIFQINTDGSGFKILHSFNGEDGDAPMTSLTVSGSTLFGSGMTTIQGSDGNIIRINTDGSGEQVLHTFSGTDGAYPTDHLTTSGTSLYGITDGGGIDFTQDYYWGYGTIFKINMDGSGFQTLYEFNDGNDGSQPMGSLTLSGSTLYGMTCTGGADDDGTIFSLDISSAGSLWQNATATGGGWYYLSPFGAFNTSSSPWIYHQTLGWLYPVGTSTDSIWFYDPQWDGTGGWWWTGSSFFPWLYSATEKEWLYYDAKDSTLSTRWFFTSTGQASTH